MTGRITCFVFPVASLPLLQDLAKPVGLSSDRADGARELKATGSQIMYLYQKAAAALPVYRSLLQLSRTGWARSRGAGLLDSCSLRDRYAE
jgi:hypothetical protein